MNRLIVVLTVLLLAGCGDRSKTIGEFMTEIRNECRGTLTLTLTKTAATFNDSVTISCTEDASDEARTKRKEADNK